MDLNCDSNTLNFCLILQEESQRQKNKMKEFDMQRTKSEKLNDLEEEAKENQEHLLAKANEMRQEQEDEIKHLNEVVFYTFY